LHAKVFALLERGEEEGGPDGVGMEDEGWLAGGGFQVRSDLRTYFTFRSKALMSVPIIHAYCFQHAQLQHRSQFFLKLGLQLCFSKNELIILNDVKAEHIKPQSHHTTFAGLA
jgi:hypothetical protein